MTVPERPSTGYYWPHAGLALALTLTVAGMALGNDRLLTGALNLLTISGIELSRRRRD